MKKAVVGSVITALLVAGASLASAAEVVSVNVVGFQKLDIVGATNYNLISVPMTKIPVYRGTITGNTSNPATISDSTANWTSGEFATNVSGKEAYGKSTFFVEITSSNAPLAGRHFYIKTNDTTTLTLVDSTLPILDNALITYSYKIVAANRLRDVLGETNSPTLNGGTTVTATGTDNVFFYIPGAGWGAPIFFQINRTGTAASRNNHWVQGTNVVDDEVIDRDEGILIKRVQNVATNITIAGEVSANNQGIVLQAPGYALIGGMSVVDVELGNSELTNGFMGGTTVTSGDDLYLWQQPSGWSAPIFYQINRTGTAASRNNHWVQGTNIVDSTLIKAGSGYLIYKRSVSDVWERESPID